MSSRRCEDTLTRSDCSLVRGKRNAGFENDEESIQDSEDTQIATKKEHSDISSVIQKTDLADENKPKECGGSRWRLLGWIFLKESCSFLDTLFSFLTLAGVFLIAQPPFLFGNPEWDGIAFDARVLGSVLSLLSAFLSPTILILMRKPGFYKVPSLVVLIFYSICGLFLSAFLTTVLQQWTLPGCGGDRIILLANGVSNFSSQILIYLALKTERAQTVALVHSCDILFSFTLEYLFFGVMPNYITAIGTFVIITSFVGITLKKLWESRKLEDRQEGNGEDNQSGTSNS
ncbi:solute carrier family 35 member G1-like [Lytechinus pictus]|uniref:solute carrier family 35 member G1-like n=1 Tax=Lytechinus pictus TaxID=7653 RepID=UPI0030B9B6F1